MERKAWGGAGCTLCSLGDRKRREGDRELACLSARPSPSCATATVNIMPNTSILPAHIGEGQKLYITPLVYTLRNVL